MSNKTIPWLLLSILMLALAIEINAKSEVPLIVVFGDSSVDSGNNNQISTLLKSNFEPYGRDFAGGRPTGRFCNGQIPSDLISQAVGGKSEIPAYLDPAYGIKDYIDGVCFASAGTGYDNSTSEVLNVIPLWKEVDYFKDYQRELRSYLGVKKADRRITEALYLISIGTNDFLENYYLLPFRPKQFTIQEYEDFLAQIAADFIKSIYTLGARKISLAGVPPMGCLPLERTANFMSGNGDCVEDLNKVAMEFNTKLRALVDKLSSQLAGIQLVFSDVYDKFQKVVQNPSMYGFENVKKGCCATGLYEMSYLCDKWSPYTCRDASKYVFWDAFHPTEKMNRILVTHLMETSLVQLL